MLIYSNNYLSNPPTDKNDIKAKSVIMVDRILFYQIGYSEDIKEEVGTLVCLEGGINMMSSLPFDLFDEQVKLALMGCVDQNTNYGENQNGDE